jgi:hypothetical protein
MTIETELLTIQQTNGGLLRPEDAVAWAKVRVESDLHKSLEWDDAVAGHAHRVWQVRRLIAIHIVSPEGNRQAVSLTIDRPRPGGGYRSVDAVMKVPDLRAVMLSDALRELDRVRQKYQTITALARVWAEVDRVRSSVDSTAA